MNESKDSVSVNVIKIKTVTDKGADCEDLLKEFEFQIDSLAADARYRDSLVMFLYKSLVNDSCTIAELNRMRIRKDSIAVLRQNQISEFQEARRNEWRIKKFWFFKPKQQQLN